MHYQGRPFGETMELCAKAVDGQSVYASLFRIYQYSVLCAVSARIVAVQEGAPAREMGDTDWTGDPVDVYTNE